MALILQLQRLLLFSVMTIFSKPKSLIIGLVLVCAPLSGYSQIPKGDVEYFTEYGTLSLNFNGGKVSGYYSDGKITGILKDSLITGSWSQSKSGGEIEIRFNRDYSNFKIRYNHSATKDSTRAIWKSNWSGIKKPPTIVRKYQSPDGLITMIFVGTQVEGTYPWYNGKLLGELIDHEFTGIWLQSNRGFGTMKITFSEDFKSFKAKYNDFNFHPDKWFQWAGQVVE